MAPAKRPFPGPDDNDEVARDLKQRARIGQPSGPGPQEFGIVVHRSDEQEPAVEEGDYWSRLPDKVMGMIAAMAGFRSIISFCATSKAMRVVIVGDCSKLSFRRMIGNRKNFPKEGFLAVRFPKAGMDGHLVVESIPPRYAREITHLFVGAIYHREKKKKNTLVRPDTSPLRGGLDDYGKHLTSLRTLVISYQVPESQSIPRDEDNQLPQYTLQLVRATKNTLRDLTILANQWFSPFDAKIMLEQIGGEKLHHLCLVLVPRTYGGSGRERETFLLRQLAKDTCTSLRGTAQIVCHSSIAPWDHRREGDFGDRCVWVYDNSFRQDFLQRHGCLQRDEAQTFCTRYCPVGFCGEWCGNFSTCTGGKPGGRVRKIRARNAFHFPYDF